MSANDVFIWTSVGWRSLQGPPGPAGASPSMMGYTYVDTPSVMPAMAAGSPIADGEVTVAPSQTTATTVTVATMSLNGTDVTVPIDAIKPGDTVYLAETMEPECRQVYLVTGNSVMYDGYAEIPVDWQMAGPDAPLTDGEEVYIAVIRVGEPGPEGPEGPEGPAGTDANYIHTQGTIDTTWTVNHGLGKYPAVMVVDSGGNWLLPDVTFVDANTVQLDFSAATFGKAYVN